MTSRRIQHDIHTDEHASNSKIFLAQDEEVGTTTSIQQQGERREITKRASYKCTEYGAERVHKYTHTHTSKHSDSVPQQEVRLSLSDSRDKITTE